MICLENSSTIVDKILPQNEFQVRLLMNNSKLQRILDAAREDPPVVLQPPQGDLKTCQVRVKEFTLHGKTYTYNDIVMVAGNEARALVEKQLLYIVEAGYCTTGSVRVGNGVSVPAYIPWRDERDKQYRQGGEYADVLLLVRLRNSRQICGGGLKVKMGAEFFIPFWLVCDLGFAFASDIGPWHQPTLLLLEHAYAPAPAHR